MRSFYFIALTLLMVFLIGCESSSTEPPGKERVIQELNRIAPSQKNEKRREKTIDEVKKIPESSYSSEKVGSGYEMPHGLFVFLKIILYIFFCLIILGIIYLIFFSSGHVRFSEAITHSSIIRQKPREWAFSEDDKMIDPFTHDFEELLKKEDVAGALLILYNASIHSLMDKGFFLKKDQLTNNEIKSLLEKDERLRDVFSQLANEVERSIFGHKKIDRMDCLELFQQYKEVF